MQWEMLRQTSTNLPVIAYQILLELNILLKFCAVQ